MGRRSSPSPVAPLVILRVLGPRQPCEGGYWIIFCSDNRKPQTRHFPFLFQHYMNGLFKKRNVPQRSGFNNAPALSAFSRVCSSQVRAVLLIRASSGTSSSWPWPWDHLHCKNSPLSGALTLMVLTWHISNRILESRSRCCPDRVFNAHFSHRGGRGGNIPAMLGSHFWGPTTS